MEIKLEQAKKVADIFVNYLKPCCYKIETVGSIRRGKAIVHDIDILLILKPEYLIREILEQYIKALNAQDLVSGPSTYRFLFQNIQFDLYFASIDNYEMLKLVRTGSADHNIVLATRAKKMGYHLYFNGAGLFDQNDIKIAGDTEESIFKALNLPYKEPKDRR